MEKFDYKKEYKDLYVPKQTPMIIEVPDINYIMVRGKGNPNDENGEYKEALSLLYGLSYTIKFSKMEKEKIDGYFEYVVPPLEGLWWNEEDNKIDFSNKDKFEWIAMIRQPEFVTDEVFKSACKKLRDKKGIDTTGAKFCNFKEGLCVQMLHIGSYDEESKTIEQIENYIESSNLKNDIGDITQNGILRRHHEIYLSDPRKTQVKNLKTVIRIPVKRKKCNEIYKC